MQKYCNSRLSSRSIIFYIALLITGFSTGYIGYKSIPYAWAECAPSKVAQLKLNSVSTDTDVNEQMNTTETDRWPTYAYITGYVFSATEGRYKVGFSKNGK